MAGALDLYVEAPLRATGEAGHHRVMLELPLGRAQLSVTSACGPAFAEVDVPDGPTALAVSLRAPDLDAGSLRVEVPAPGGRERVSVTLMRGPAILYRFPPGIERVDDLPTGTYTLAPTASEPRARCRRAWRFDRASLPRHRLSRP